MLPVFIMAIENDDDRTFVAELYARCQPAMQRRALSILKNESDAEEAVHEAIVIPRFGAFSEYCKHLAVNRLLLIHNAPP